MVTLTREAVGKVARALITLNGSTTTLDVKLALRKIGFYATQDEVRYFMLDITSADGDIQYTDGGSGFRVYSFRTPILPTDSTQTSDSIQDSTPITTSVVTVTLPVHRDHVPANYTVMDEDGFYVRQYTNVTRAQAKRLWEKETGMPFTSARTLKR